VALAFSGDTADCPEFWQMTHDDPALKAVIVECSYPASMKEMASLSMHLDTSALVPRLAALPNGVTAVVIHRKPGGEEQIATELKAGLPGKDLRLPVSGEVLSFSA